MSARHPYPEYKDSGNEWLGKVPVAWRVARLKNILVTKITDGPHTTPVFIDDGVPFLSVDGIQEGELVFESCRYVSETDHQQFSRKARPQRDDILMGKAASTGKIARVKVDREFSIWSPLALIRIDPELAVAGYAEYALKSTPAQARIDVLCTSNTQKNISMEDIPRVDILLPPLAEQHAIASYLDIETAEIDRFIEDQNELIDLLNERRTATITQAMTKGLDLSATMKDSGVVWLGMVPAGWQVMPLRHLLASKLKYGANEAAEHDNPDWVRYLRITDFNNDGTLRDSTFKSLPPEIAGDYMVKPNDILLARSGATVGKAFIVPVDSPPSCFAGYLIRVECDGRKIIPQHLYNYTQSAAFSGWKDASSTVATIQNIGADKYAGLPVPVPPVTEQQQIIDFIDFETAEIDAALADAKKAIELSKERRSALITAAVTGKIDVRNRKMAELGAA